jgi:hypothetical protein
MASEENHHHPVERRRSSHRHRSRSSRRHLSRQQLRKIGFFVVLAVASLVAGYMVSRCELTTEPAAATSPAMRKGVGRISERKGRTIGLYAPGIGAGSLSKPTTATIDHGAPAGGRRTPPGLLA